MKKIAIIIYLILSASCIFGQDTTAQTEVLNFGFSERVWDLIIGAGVTLGLALIARSGEKSILRNNGKLKD